jgi:hypothetical protein
MIIQPAHEVTAEFGSWGGETLNPSGRRQSGGRTARRDRSQIRRRENHGPFG